MILYHGSNIQIDVIDLQKGKKGKDFGKGFYLSPSLQQAQRMAELTVMKTGQGSPIVTEYDFNEELSILLKRLDFTSYNKEWAEFVIMNRMNTSDIQAHDYDIVYGPIADDTVGATMQLFQRKFISMDELIARLKFKNPKFQYFFGTSTAIKMLKRL